MKFVLAFLAALFVTSFSVCAADLDAVDNYNFDPVSMSALDYAIMPLADTMTGWSSEDSDNLYQIYRSLIFNVSAYPGSIVQSLRDIRDALYASPTVSSGSLVDNVRKIYLSASSSALSLEEINDAVQNDSDSLKDLLKSIWADTDSIYANLYEYNPRMTNYLDYLSSYFCFQLWSFPLVDLEGNIVGSYENKFFSNFFEYFINASYDGLNYESRERTLYSRLKQLQEVLASDDDKALADSQLANREEIEDSFLNGSSGSTSLGASDFGDLSDVGGSVKDMLSLDGNATVSSFVSGMTAADSAGSGWFSESTRSQLDSVTSSASTYSRSDPYNMSGWQDRYYWLIGDDVNG